MDNLKQGYIKEPYPVKVKRYCQVLTLKGDSDSIEEYKFWHKKENIWKEIPEGIKKAGILDMEIYLCGNVEFMIVETPLDFDWDKAFGELATYERQAEWEDFIAKYQRAGCGQRSEQKWHLMERIFSLNE